MVCGMGIERQSLKNASGAIWSMVLLAVWAHGCGAPPSSESMAPPSAVPLSPEQERAMTAALVMASVGAPPSSQLELVPPNGIRWSDLRRAMDKAAIDSDLAVVSEVEVDPDTRQFTLVSVEGWPAVVRVSRLDAAPWVEASAKMGPSPELRGMRVRAAELEASFMKWMVAFGRMPRVPSIY